MESTQMIDSREVFEEWVKKEHAHIFNGAERGDVRFRMDIDFMYMAWQASASREGYKLVPLNPTDEMIEAGCRAYMDCGVTQVYKAMVGVFHED